MVECFFNIRNRVLSYGTQIEEHKWKLESCVYESLIDSEKITVPGLVEALLVNKGNAVVIVNGSEDALKFLEASI